MQRGICVSQSCSEGFAVQGPIATATPRHAGAGWDAVEVSHDGNADREVYLFSNSSADLKRLVGEARVETTTVPRCCGRRCASQKARIKTSLDAATRSTKARAGTHVARVGRRMELRTC